MPQAHIQVSPTVEIVIDAPEGANGATTQAALIEGIAFWQSIPTVCPMPGCGATLHFSARHPQTFHYYGVVCEGPKAHEMTFGERKDHTSYYMKPDTWRDAYGGGDGQQEESASASGPAPAQSSAPAQAFPTGEKVDAGTVRMVQAVANSKSPKPDLDGLAKQFFGTTLAECSKENAMAVLEYLKSI